MRTLVIALLLSGLVTALTSAATADSNLPPPPNIRITTIPQLNNEEQVFICPTDSLVVIANWRDFRLGYRQIGIGRSADGGYTWTDSLIPWTNQYFREQSQQSDPTMTVDRMGRFYMSVLDYIPGQPVNGSIIGFYRSDDKGLSWVGPFAHAPLGAFFEDKQFITVDRTGGPHDGNLYCAWARFNNPNRIMFVRSTDGAETFNDTLIIGPIQTSSGCGTARLDAGQFANPVVSTGGRVHVFWQGFALDSAAACTGEMTIKQRYSDDGGQTFLTERIVTPVSGWTQADGGIATYSQPASDADITGGPFDGHVYLAFTNIGPEDPLANSDIDFVRSTDNGLTWSDRLQINDDANSEFTDNFHPWLIVNDEGVVIVIFYDQRYDAGHFLFDLMAAYSFDGGQSFTANHRISNTSSSPGELKAGDGLLPWTLDENGFQRPLASPHAGLIGEYIGVTAFHDKINAVWTDSRDGNSEVYTANWYLPLLEPRLFAPAEGAVAQQVEFSWATSWKHNADRYRLELSPTADFSSGVVAHTTDTNSFASIDPLADGIWYWRVKTLTVAGDDSSAYSVVRTFTIDHTPPSPPILLLPTDNRITNDPTPAFSWEDDPAEASLDYSLLVSLDTLFPAGPATQTYTVTNQWTLEPGDPLPDGIPVFWKVLAADAAGNTSESSVRSLTYRAFVCGDVDGSGGVTVSDLTFLVNYLFKSGTPPPIATAADVNHDGLLNVSDLTFLVNFLFRGGPLPVC